MAAGRVKFGLSQPFDSTSASTINKYNVLLDTIINRRRRILRLLIVRSEVINRKRRTSILNAK